MILIQFLKHSVCSSYSETCLLLCLESLFLIHYLNILYIIAITIIICEGILTMCTLFFFAVVGSSYLPFNTIKIFNWHCSLLLSLAFIFYYAFNSISYPLFDFQFIFISAWFFLFLFFCFVLTFLVFSCFSYGALIKTFFLLDFLFF